MENPPHDKFIRTVYNKLFSKILDSSVWLLPHTTRIVWFTFLASMDEDGFCQFAAVQNLANRAIVTLEEAQAAVNVLEAPDPNSSNRDNEGRRVERVPGGWIVLNAVKYRELATREQIRKNTRQRVQDFRDAKSAESTGVTLSEAVSEAEVSSPTTAARSFPDTEIPPDSDVKIDEIAKAHPRFIRPARTHEAIATQWERLSRTKGVEGARVYLLERTQLYKKLTDGWPPGERQFIVGSPDWFRESCFEENETDWMWTDAKSERNHQQQGTRAQSRGNSGTKAGAFDSGKGGKQFDRPPDFTFK